MPKPARLLVALGCLLALLPLHAADAKPRCTPPVLVLSAMPLELNPLVRAAHVTAQQVQDGRTFYRGRLAGRDVVLAMTGIGPVNARETAAAALRLPGCGFRAALFSGVAGSRGYIGDVAVPRRWTSDDGRSWTPVDPTLLAVARRLRTPALTQDVPVGDAACACPGVDAATPVHVPHQPVLRVGGDGTTSDPFGGRAVPCLPGGGDIAGCEPCLTAQGIPSNAETFARRAAPLVDPAFLRALLTPPAATTTAADAQDEETAAVAQLLHKARVPFLGVRGVSDGQGDPLGLPGFPVQFVVYRQLAADNAAAVTLALLQALPGR